MINSEFLNFNEIKETFDEMKNLVSFFADALNQYGNRLNRCEKVIYNLNEKTSSILEKCEK